MARSDFAVFVLFGVLPATYLGAMAGWTLTMTLAYSQSFLISAIAIVWAAFGIAGVISLISAIFAPPRKLRRAGVVLGILAAIPLLALFPEALRRFARDESDLFTPVPALAALVIIAGIWYLKNVDYRIWPNARETR